MIHYHGTRIGGKKCDAPEILRGRHALVSYAEPSDLPIVMDVCQSFVLDNGAFSAWNQTGERVNVKTYHEWVSQYYRHPGFDWCLIPDTIDGTHEDNHEMLVQWSNLNRKTQIRCMPVFHFHEPLEVLQTMLAATHSRVYEGIALGSSGEYPNPGTQKWWKRMDEIMGVLCDEDGRPKCKIHGLRMLDPLIFQQVPLSSADSTNAGRNNNQLNRFGMYPPPTAGQRAAVIAARIESFNSAPIYMGQRQEELF